MRHNGHMTTSINTAGAIPEFELKHRVRLAREYASLQQSDLAELTGLSRTAIANLERGSSDPRRATISLIAFATGVDRHWLETGETPGGDMPTGGESVRHQGIEPRTHCLMMVA